HTRSKRDWSSDVCSSDLSLTTAGGVDHRSTHGIPESGHLRDVRHDFTFLGVFHGGGNTWIFRQLFLVRLQRYGTQRFVFINRFQTFVSQQIVFEELFRQLFVRTGGVNTCAQHANERFGDRKSVV